jgi:hypothetical protein
MAKIVSLLWKAPVVVGAVTFGSFGAYQAAWSGADSLLNWGLMGAFERVITWLYFLGGGAITVGTLSGVYRIAKPALWVMVPLMAYSALVVGVWNGIASDFDYSRGEALRHPAQPANSYALQHMTPRGLYRSCHDERIKLTEDGQAFCKRALSVGPGERVPGSEHWCGGLLERLLGMNVCFYSGTKE